MNYFKQSSARLRYRKLTQEDVIPWSNFFANNDRLKFLGIDLDKSHDIQAKEWVEKQFFRYEKDGLGYLAIELASTNELIGMGGILKKVIEGKTEYEIAYSLLPKFWGNGYATELAIQMKEFGFLSLEIERLISIIHQDNISSKKVALKNEMILLRKTQCKGMNVEIYAINNNQV